MKFFVFIFAGLVLAFGAAAQGAPTVDLVWTADTYKPPFYRGHTLATPQSQIKVTAMVSGAGIDPANLDYRWQRDGQNLTRASGLGKNTLTFSAGQVGETYQVELRITNAGGTIKLNQTTKITVATPRISFYRNESLTGVNYDRAIGADLVLTQPEVSLLAEPYFFPSADVENRKIDYRWQLNGTRAVPDSADGRLITFAAPAEVSGESVIGLSAESLNNVFQTAKREFKITFGNINFNF